MPELPEVETILRDLNPLLKGQTISSLTVHWKNLLENISKESFSKACIGNKVTSIKRIGKYLLFTLDNNSSFSLHLRMSGRLLLASNKAEITPSLSLELRFASGFFLQMFDVRHLGKALFFATRTQQKTFFSSKKFGPDPLTDTFTIEYLKQKCTKSKQPLKTFLLDQSIIAGIGNIYASEILWTAKLHPTRHGCDLIEKEILALFYSIKLILNKAVEKRGTSISDFFDALGVAGEFQHFLSVYDRENKICPACTKKKIRRSIIAGRSTFFCPGCQK